MLAGGLAGLAALAGGIGYFAPRPAPPPPGIAALNAEGFPNPAAATRAEPFVNSLGMTLLPVPRVPVLFCRHETRISDWLVYLDGIRDEQDEWLQTYGSNIGRRRRLYSLTPDDWTLAALDVEDLHGVFGTAPGRDLALAGVALLQARRYCAWLTWREQREGQLSPGQFYRLPTDEDWSAAGESAAAGFRAVRHPDDDPDGDGSRNLVEYFTGTDPLAGSPSVLTANLTGNQMRMTYPVADHVAVNTWRAAFQISQNLSVWSPSVQTPVLFGADGNASRHEVFFNAGVPKRFARLLVEPVP